MSRLNDRLREMQQNEPGWSAPTKIAPNDDETLSRMLDSGAIQGVRDEISIIEEDMRKAKLLSDDEDVENRTNWVHFPWSGQLVRYPDAAAHHFLRTYRNRPVITAEEQQAVRDARIAFFGLSVGSRVVQQAVESGTGNQYMLADYDTVEPTNLNRMQATMENIGESKLSYVAKSVSKKDPYIDIIPVDDGYTPGTPRVLDAFKPQIIVEEVDNLAVKAMIRQYAAENGIPVIMVTDLGEKSLVDIERYDLDPTTKPFHGAIDESLFEDLASGKELSDKERTKIMIKMTGGLRTIPPRLIQGALEMKRGTVSGIPQLGRTAAAGAVYADMVMQDILIGRDISSGRSVSNPRQTLSLPKVDPPGRVAGTYWSFLKSELLHS